MATSVLVLYDGDCRFCRWGIEWVRRVDVRQRLEFCPFGESLAEEALAELPDPERYESMHAVAGGRLYSGADAARLVLEKLPLGQVPAAIGLHHLYPLLAALRPVLGRLVPDRSATSDCRDRASL